MPLRLPVEPTPGPANVRHYRRALHPWKFLPATLTREVERLRRLWLRARPI